MTHRSLFLCSRHHFHPNATLRERSRCTTACMCVCVCVHARLRARLSVYKRACVLEASTPPPLPSTNPHSPSLCSRHHVNPPTHPYELGGGASMCLCVCVCLCVRKSGSARGMPPPPTPPSLFSLFLFLSLSLSLLSLSLSLPFCLAHTHTLSLSLFFSFFFSLSLSLFFSVPLSAQNIKFSLLFFPFISTPQRHPARREAAPHPILTNKKRFT